MITRTASRGAGPGAPTTLRAVALLLWLAATAASGTVRVAENGLVLACAQPGPASMRCDYRIGREAEVLGVSARIGDLDLPDPQFAAQGGRNDPVAVLVMVEDTLLVDDASRERVVALVQRLSSGAGPRFRFGLAAFSDQFRVTAPLGSGLQALVQRLSEPPPASNPVLLYRSVTGALDRLAETSLQRRALLLLAMGTTRDQQHDHAGTAREARSRDIPIYTVAVDADEEGALRLERLSLDTGGHHARSSPSGGLTEAYFSAPFAGLDNAGALSLDLSSAAGLARGEHSMSITLDTAAGSISATVPLFLAGANGAPAPARLEPASTGATTPAAPVARAQPTPRRPTPPQRTPLLVWVLGGVAIALVLAIGVLVAMMLRRRKARRLDTSHSRRVQREGPGVPHVVVAEQPSLAHAVVANPFKIGRLGNNDLVLSDPSVSRHHAEILLGEDGRCTIRDLESMNGVYVNNRKVRERVLRDRDELEIGDVRLGFELRYEAIGDTGEPDFPAESLDETSATGRFGR